MFCDKYEVLTSAKLHEYHGGGQRAPIKYKFSTKQITNNVKQVPNVLISDKA